MRLPSKRLNTATQHADVPAEPSRYTGGVEPGERTILDIEVAPELCMNFLNCMRIATGGFGRDPETGKTRPTRWRQVESARLWRAGWSCPSGAIRFITDRGYVVPRWEEAVNWRTEQHPAAGRRR